MDARKHLINRIIQAARGHGTGAVSRPPRPISKLPCFPLKRHHIGKVTGGSIDHGIDGVASPDDFHSFLCERIHGAQRRVVLASLYIGVGSGNASLVSSTTPAVVDDGKSCKEDELLQALHNAASNNNLEKMQILLDVNRALRKVSVTTNKSRQSHGAEPKNIIQTNSAEAVLSEIDPFIRSYNNNNNNNNNNQQRNVQNGLFLFPVHGKRLRTILPSPLNEVAGVFHIKAYIVDDELILSGANLSEEYFRNRIDRYMLFTNGGGGLVDFYVDLCDVLCEYAIRYDGQQINNMRRDLVDSWISSRDEKDRKEKLEHSLMRLFDGNSHFQELTDGENNEDVIAYAIPTLQVPTSFADRPICIPSDTEVTQNLLITSLDCNEENSASVRLSSAYLNLTQKLLSVLTTYGRTTTNAGGAPYILTAGPISHGFAPKKGGVSMRRKASIVEYVKGTIPKAFLTLVKETAQSIMSAGGKVFLYEREGWTFHAKGIWITAIDGRNNLDSHHPELIKEPSSLLAAIIGSSNYGARSEDLDVESNCIIIFKDYPSNDDNGCHNVKKAIAAEWNDMCQPSKEWKEENSANDDSTSIMRLVLELLRRYL